MKVNLGTTMTTGAESVVVDHVRCWVCHELVPEDPDPVVLLLARSRVSAADPLLRLPGRTRRRRRRAIPLAGAAADHPARPPFPG